MNWSYPPPYGNAFCCHCCQQFDLTFAKPTFAEKAPHNDAIVYVMCPDCHKKHANGTKQQRKAMSNECFVNVKLRGFSHDGRRYPFACTTIVTLLLNDDCLIAAIENGHDLTYSEYFALCSQLPEFTFLTQEPRSSNASQ